jgi:nucleoside-diphosphate-sugar epimerase
LPQGVRSVRVDINRHGSLADALAGEDFDAAVHMIASSADRVSEVLEAVGSHIGRYVQCGSTGVYTPLSYVPADEAHPTDPLPEYGGFVGKLEADREAHRICAEQGLPLTILQPTNIMGPGDVPIDVWGSRNPAFFRRILGGQLVSIPSDGRALLQPGDVRDLADAFVAALDRPEQTGVYIISCRYAITLNYYVTLLGEALGRKAVTEYVPAEDLIAEHASAGKVHAGGLLFLCEHMCFTIAKAQRDLGYSPQYRPEDSIADSVQWMVDEGILGHEMYS